MTEEREQAEPVNSNPKVVVLPRRLRYVTLDDYLPRHLEHTRSLLPSATIIPIPRRGGSNV